MKKPSWKEMVARFKVLEEEIPNLEDWDATTKDLAMTLALLVNALEVELKKSRKDHGR